MMKDKKSAKIAVYLFKGFCISVVIITFFLVFVKFKNDISYYMQSQPVIAEVVCINEVNANNITIKYKYNFFGKEYESTATQHLEKIKKGDKKEIRVNTKEPKIILKYSDLSSVVFSFIAIVLCVIGSIGFFCECLN